MPELFYFLASAGNLFLANLVIFRARRARGALPIALLCVSLFLWAISEAVGRVAAREGTTEPTNWSYIRLVGSSMAPAFFWHFVVVFVQREKELRGWRAALYVATSAFAIFTMGALFSAPLARWVDDRRWHLAYLVVLFPFLLWALALVRRRLREVETPLERNALLFVEIGIAVGTFTGLTDLAQFFWDKIPPLGHVGSVLCTSVLAASILRHRMLEEETPVKRLLFPFLLVFSSAFVLTVLYMAVARAWKPTLVAGAVASITALALYRFAFVRWYEQVERRKRLVTIGTMAAGVAHEIKNPLAAIKGAAQFVQKELEGVEGKPEAKDYLKLLVGEVDRLNGVVENFLDYARPIEPRRQDVTLHLFLRDFLRLQAASIPPAIRLESAFDENLPPVQADPALLTQAVSNVVRNAVEAMPEGGTLSIRTRLFVTALWTYAAVEVVDTGPGISRDDLARLFQPFFTTKSKGTGLGLAIARRILEAHGGDILVESAAPRGCRFTFLLALPAL